jgi:ABC-type amino acid transport system permease subunit
MRSEAQRKWTGVAIVAGSIALFFWWGIHFHVFGSKFDVKGRPIETLGFFGWIAAALFGSGYAAGGVRSGLKAVATFLALMAVATILGILRGAYR